MDSLRQIYFRLNQEKMYINKKADYNINSKVGHSCLDTQSN